MRRAAAALALLAALAGSPAAAAVSTSPSPGPSSRPSPTASPLSHSASPSPSPAAAGPAASPARDPALIAALQGRIGRDLALGLQKQQQMADELAASAAREQALDGQIAQSQERLSQLQDQVAALDGQIQDTQDRVEVDRGEVGALVRALARRPESALLAIAGSRTLGDALRRGTDLLVAGRRAHALQQKLEADLARLDTERAQRQADADRETALQESLQSAYEQLDAVVSRQQELGFALEDLLSQFHDALSALPEQPADVSSRLVELLEQQQRSLNTAAASQAWSAAHVGAGTVQVLKQLARPVPGQAMLLPIAGARLTQGFGPSDLWFEPPLGQYAHFHTGVDLAAPAGTPVFAAADGVVAAVGSTAGGYGNYLVVAHGGGLLSLYGHLLAATVTQGQPVKAGDVIGAEGSTGFSTGPHLHFEVRLGDSVVDPSAYLALPAAV